MPTLFNDGTISAGQGILGVDLLVNHGSIATTVTLASGGAQGATLANYGRIATAATTYVVMATAPATVINAGTIQGIEGIQLNAGGSIANTGQITAGGNAIYASGTVQAITNSGSITGSAGIFLSGTGLGVVTNTSSGVIAGTAAHEDGLFIRGERATVINAGTITGSDAIYFQGTSPTGSSSTPGAVFVGIVQGGTGSNTLELAAGTGGNAGTISGLFSQFLGFSTIDIDAGAPWSLVNAGSVASPTDLIDNGTLSVGGSLVGNIDINGAGTLRNEGTVSILGSLDVPTLFNDGTISAGQGILGVDLLVNHRQHRDHGDAGRRGGRRVRRSPITARSPLQRSIPFWRRTLWRS